MPDADAHALAPLPVNAPAEGDRKHPPGRDISPRIKGMGVFQMVLGGISLFFALLSFVGSLVGGIIYQGREEANAAGLWYAVATYLFAAFFFFVVGIGSVRLRRWVRPLVLSVMWPALVLGTLGFGLAVYLLPQLAQALVVPGAISSPVSSAVLKATEIVALGLLFIVGVLVPGLHVAIYHGRRAQETLAAHDPKERWTDRCPTPVIGIVITLVSIGLMQLAAALGGVMLFFGLVLKGPAALAVGLVELGVCLAAARLAYKLDLKGYWMSFYYLLFVCAKNAVSFTVMDLLEVYRRAGDLDESQMAQAAALLRAVPTTTPILVLWLLAAGSAILYMWAIKKHFHHRNAGLTR